MISAVAGSGLGGAASSSSGHGPTRGSSTVNNTPRASISSVATVKGLRFQNSSDLWILSPENKNLLGTSDNSEDVTSLIQDSLEVGGVSVGNKGGPETGEIKLTSSPNFIRMPLEDRNKYEKLHSGNDITSDDSDSEFYPSDVTNTRTIFKQIVSNNIPEKISAAYHKVDKSQIKLPTVKKLRLRQPHHSGAGHKESDVQGKASKASKHETNSVATSQKHKQEQRHSDSDDSIGSASDLKADEFAEDELDEGRGGTLKRQPSKMDDCISESIKTCGSSAYHAECESVTTHEDDVSRVVTKVRMKKRDRMSDSTNTIIDSQQSAEEDLIHGDKPLLLDDELDYDSSENTDGTKQKRDRGDIEGNSSDSSHSSDDTLDVFALAPFKMPTVLPKRSKQREKVKYRPTAVTIPEDSNLLNFETDEGTSSVVSQFVTSTPKKPTPDFFSMESPKDATTTSQPFYVTNNLPTTVTTVPAPITRTIISVDDAPMQHSQVQDLFGSEPFRPLSSHQDPSAKTVVTVNQAIVIDRTTPLAISTMMTRKPETAPNYAPQTIPHTNFEAPHSKYINYNQIDTLQGQQSDKMLPIADNEFISFYDDEPLDDSDETNPIDDIVVGGGLEDLGGGKKSRKDKKDKTSKHKEKKYKEEGHSALSVKLAQKVKSGTGYKKVSSSKAVKPIKMTGVDLAQDAYQSLNNQHALNASKNSTITGGFSNMSFEDFPSDQEIVPAVVRQTAAPAPFEVVRNEKMLAEAEKKFGSLKRRSNPFS